MFDRTDLNRGPDLLRVFGFIQSERFLILVLIQWSKVECFDKGFCYASWNLEERGFIRETAPWWGVECLNVDCVCVGYLLCFNTANILGMYKQSTGRNSLSQSSFSGLLAILLRW